MQSKVIIAVDQTLPNKFYILCFRNFQDPRIITTLGVLLGLNFEGVDSFTDKKTNGTTENMDTTPDPQSSHASHKSSSDKSNASTSQSTDSQSKSEQSLSESAQKVSVCSRGILASMRENLSEIIKDSLF